MSGPRVAIVHDYLNQRGGAERVVGAIHRIFPEAPILTSIVDRRSLWPELADATIVPTWMQRLPGVLRHFKAYVWAYPIAFERLDLRGFDLVLSSSSTFAKGVHAPPAAAHLCYCHAPSRFVWDQDRYLVGEGFGRFARGILRKVLAPIAAWDTRAARRPDRILTNSRAMATRIHAVYGRDATIVPPPVATERFAPSGAEGTYYLALARLAGYKRVDLAVRACARLGRDLVVAGDGPARAALAAIAGPRTRFVGRVPEADLPSLYAGARALLVGAEEDFGITMVEAHAAARPVVAFAAGGAPDIVVDGENGLLFDAQEVDAMERAIVRCESIRWDGARIRASAERFSADAFRARYLAQVEAALGAPITRPARP